MRNLPEVTEEVEQEIRDEHTELIISTSGSNANTKLHIPDGDEPTCRANLRNGESQNEELTTEWVKKPTAVYPPGHKGMCRLCAARWKNDK